MRKKPEHKEMEGLYKYFQYFLFVYISSWFCFLFISPFTRGGLSFNRRRCDFLCHLQGRCIELGQLIDIQLMVSAVIIGIVSLKIQWKEFVNRFTIN